MIDGLYNTAVITLLLLACYKLYKYYVTPQHYYVDKETKDLIDKLYDLKAQHSKILQCIFDYDTARFGTTDKTASVNETDKNPTREGYTFDETNTNNVLSGNINGDGSLVLKVYFKKTFSVKYEPGDKGLFDEQVYNNLEYNSTTPAFEGETPGKPGYTFNGWNPVVKEKVTNNATYTAVWKPNTNTKYHVEFYYQENGNYPESATHKKVIIWRQNNFCNSGRNVIICMINLLFERFLN